MKAVTATGVNLRIWAILGRKQDDLAGFLSLCWRLRSRVQAHIRVGKPGIAMQMGGDEMITSASQRLTLVRCRWAADRDDTGVMNATNVTHCASGIATWDVDREIHQGQKRGSTSMKEITVQSTRLRRLALATLAACIAPAGPVVAQEVSGMEEIVVKGYRTSLGAALDVKRNAVGQTDAIVAEDIADFPDLNLAESLQRIPGVAISRSNGEGKNITVRGLSGQYTRVRINGMESRAGTGTSNERDFDFNLFASELFNSIVVHKTARAELDEGSLGATVDLNTGRAFSYDEGSTFLVSGTMHHNDLGDDYSPRMVALYAFNDPNRIWGATVSLAYSEIESSLHSSNTVRWQRATYNSVNGVTCDPANLTGDCGVVADNFGARIPRYAVNRQTHDRLGATFGLQFQPVDSTGFTFDALVASFDFTTDSRPLEVLFRGNEGGMDVVDYTLEEAPGRARGDGTVLGNGTITSMTVDNAWVRSEHYYEEEENDFSQFTLNFDHEFSDNVRVHALLGSADSEGHQPITTTMMFDDRAYMGFHYDYSTGDRTPILAYNGADVADGATFFLTDLRDQVHTTETSNDTFNVNLEWDISEALQLKGGISAKKFTMDTQQDRRDGTACGHFGGCAPGEPGIRMTQALSEITHFPGPAGPGSTTTWATPNIAAIDDAFGFYAVPLTVDQGRHRSVEEKNTGVFVQLGGELALGGMRFLYDAGVRYVETDQTSAGFFAGEWRVIDRPTYNDTLPSFNTALWLNDEFVLRFAAADVLARPALGDLSPGGNVNSFSNFSVTEFNPLLDPNRARNLDLSAEWYFADDALFAVAIFHKDVESFATRETRTDVTYASTGFPVSLIDPTSPIVDTPEGPPGSSCLVENGGTGCWDHSRTINGPGATIKGYEIGFQSPFSSLFGGDLPAVIRNMGLIANYTYADGEEPFTFQGIDFTDRLRNLSKDQWNLTVYYENEKFSARASGAYRSDFRTSSPDVNGNLFEWTEPSTYVDLSARYAVNDNFSITAEALNLTDEPLYTHVDIDNPRLLSLDYTGRNILIGARYSF